MNITKSEKLQDRIDVLEAELAEARKAANVATKAKAEFLANMNHEMRTPIHAMIGFAGLLQNDPEATKSQRERARYIEEASNGMLGMINDLLILAKLEIGRIVPYLVHFDLPSLMREAVSQCRGSAVLKDLDLRYVIDQEIPCVLYGDRCRIRELIVSLLSNAVKFTDHGKIVLRIGIEEETEGILTLRFDVEDTGPGIPQQMQQSIFELFTQGDGSINRQHEGIGLGLSLCSRIAQLLEGSVYVKSTLGQGSVFSALLPFCKNTSNSKKSGDHMKSQKDSLSFSQEKQLQEQSFRRRFLIVDDDRLCRVLMKDMLSKFGECDFASNGNEAIQLFSDSLKDGKYYDLICLDIMMPSMDGHTALTAMRGLEDEHGVLAGEGAKVVMTTALRESKHCVQAFIEGCEAYVTKPVRENDLLDKLRLLGVLDKSPAVGE